MRNLKHELAAGKVAIGVVIALPWVEAVEMAGYAGYDFILIDTEHGAIDASDGQALVLAAQGANVAPIWRVSGPSRREIKKALDWGAAGILVPEIRTAENAASIVQAAKYPPAGRRGVGPHRPIRYSLDDTKAYIKQANHEVLVCLMIELPEAVENIEEIVQVEGIDVLNIGRSDLSTSLGVPLEFEHPDVLDAVDRVLAAALPRNLVVGLGGGTAEHISRWTRRGVRFFESAVVPYMLAAAMHQHVAGLRTAIED